MAILTQFPSRRWQITLNRAESSTETALMPNAFNVTVPNPPNVNLVIGITGTGLMRIITLTEAVDAIPIANIVISQSSYTGMMVTATQNADLLDFLQQIRNLLRIGLSSTDLPDSTILEQVFLRAAELEVYDALDLTDATYDAKALNDPAFRERTQNAVLYRAAAKILYSLPEIVSETVLQQSVRYREIDIDNKITFWLNLSNQSIEPDVVDPQYRSGAVIGSSWTIPFSY